MRIDNQEIRNADIFETIVDHFPDIIHSVDADGNIVFANNRAETLLGYSLDELLTMNVRELYSDEVLEALEKGFDNLKKTGETTVESVLKDKNGNRIPVEIRSFGIYDDDGNFIRTFSNLRDIREIKELQQSLIHAGRLAAIGELASGIVHDINNPVSVIKFCLDETRMDAEDDTLSTEQKLEQAQECLADIGRATESILKLVSHLRTFSRGIADRKDFIDLGRAIEDALFLTKSRVHANSVKIDNSVEPGRHYTSGCANHIEQVFANLISNACDAFDGRSGREIHIGIRPHSCDEGAFWECSVRDTGTGISEDLTEKIWSSFFTTKEEGKGTGLGLAIVRGIVTDHGGEITLDSTEGEGSTFTVRLPQATREA